MSQQRNCRYWKATDDQWYVELGNFEYAQESCDCTRYGPFSSLEKAESFVDRGFSNPGGSYTDDSGTQPPPSDAQPGQLRQRESGYFRPYHRFC